MNKQAKLDAFMKENISKNIEEDMEGIQGPYDLPEGWKWTKLKNIAEIIMGQSPPSITYNKEGKGLPFYQGKADFGVLYPTPHVWCSEPNKIAEAGDVLISVRAPVGPVNLCKERSCIGRGLAAIRPRNHVFNNFFLFYYLRSIENKWIGKGSTFEAIKKKDLENLLIPLPPLEEQKRIVSRLDHLVSRAEEAKRLRKLAREEAEKIMHAALNKVFSKAEEEGWEWVKLKELVLIESGKRPKGGSTGTGIPSLGGEQLLPTGKVNWEKLRYVPEDFFDTLKKGKVKQGDVLVVKDGATTGKTAYVESLPFKKVAVNEHVFIVRSLDESRLLNKYLFFVLFSEIGQKQIRDLFHGAAQGGITQRNVEEISIPLPTLDEQKRIIVYLDKLRETIVSIRGLQQKTEEELEKFVPSILDKAFRGEL
jgi:type I restriction enzyme S subunit